MTDTPLSLESWEPRVALVGAGPGHPGLLTLRGLELLRRADFVLYDQLVSTRLLDYAPQAEKLCVDQLPGCHPERWPGINQSMIDAAKQGKRVVRLKGGDPLVFGRGGEEAEALREAGIPFEIVPGVTAALGAASFAGVPLTHRQHSSAVAFVTGHEDPAKPGSSLDWEALARFPGTLVFYMGIRHLERIRESLLARGKAATTPAIVVQYATQGRQRSVEGTLIDLPERARAAGIVAPALVVVGGVVGLRPVVNWFEKRPLFGRRILVTRPAEQAGGMAAQLEQLGATVQTLPTVRIGPPPDWTPVDNALSQLDRYQWLVFTSVNGVEWFLRRLREGGRDLRALGGVKLAAIGPATAEALARYYLQADLMPAEYRSENLAAELKPHVAGQRVLLARADRGREVLRDELAGVAEVEQVAVYSQIDAVDVHSEGMRLLCAGDIDVVTLTSSNIVRALARSLDEATQQRLCRGEIAVATISPVTSAAVRELGWQIAVEAREYSVRGLVQALLESGQGCPRD